MSLKYVETVLLIPQPPCFFFFFICIHLVTIQDVAGFTPLHVAVQFGRTSTAAYLIAAGQSADERDETMMTPAMWAAYKV